MGVVFLSVTSAVIPLKQVDELDQDIFFFLVVIINGYRYPDYVFRVSFLPGGR